MTLFLELGSLALLILGGWLGAKLHELFGKQRKHLKALYLALGSDSYEQAVETVKFLTRDKR